jgi:uncharacterized membrane protein YhaH (DUF805 family)
MAAAFISADTENNYAFTIGVMVEYYLTVWRKYAVFSGRASRSEYWFFALFNFVISVVLEIPYFFAHALGNDALATVVAAPLFLYSLAILIPSFAVNIRRLHDINKSGWWILIALIPFVGAIVLLVFDCMPGTEGSNEFGPDPKVIAATVA